MSNHSVIYRGVFGSRLYGTATPSSDYDYKGIVYPTRDEVLLGRIPKTVNTVKDDKTGEDSDMYSLHHFVRLAAQGQTVAIDMLWTPSTMWTEASETWQELVSLRDRFLSRNMGAFTGYARSQAAKYSLKGGRLKKLREAVNIVSRRRDEALFEGVITPLIEANLHDDLRINQQDVQEIQIAGKWFGATTQCHFVKAALEKQIKRYGSRAQEASCTDADWKAMSHALRVSLELEDLLTTRNIEFPLLYADLLLEIKQGKKEIGEVQAMIDAALERVSLLVYYSELPPQVDHKFWDEWLAEKTLCSMV